MLGDAMRKKTKNQIHAEKRNATRDLMRELPDYCERNGYVMPAEFLIAVMNGTDPRVGKHLSEDDLLEGITLGQSLEAAKTLAKYLYTTASSLKLDGKVDIRVPNVVITEKIVKSLDDKLEGML
jgi:hypothetical protein